MRENDYRLIDLFCGAGGLTLGFTRCSGGFVPVFANEVDESAAETYNANFGSHCMVEDIVTVLENPDVVFPKADVVIGGPPCQGFSLLNKNRSADTRKSLWRPFMEVVERSEASIFVIENVPQIIDSPEYTEIVHCAESMGFQVGADRLCAADYGVPQVRWRAFIIGCRFADPLEFFPPLKTHINAIGKARTLFHTDVGCVEQPERWKTVRDAIGDLPEPKGIEIRSEAAPLDIHFGRTPTAKSLKRYKAIPKEGMNRFDLQANAPRLTPQCWIRKTTGGTDLFGRLWWNRPAFTIRTEFFKPEKGRYLHPAQHRPITHREAARFQSFPDDFLFKGTKLEIARQIGNAVPPLLAGAVAETVKKLLDKYNRRDGRLLQKEAQLDHESCSWQEHNAREIDPLVATPNGLPVQT